jgi:hypothetical protein
MIPLVLIYEILRYSPAFGLSEKVIFEQKLRIQSYMILKNYINGLQMEDYSQIRKIIFNYSFESKIPWECTFFEYNSNDYYLCIFPEQRKGEPKYFIIFY